jgi:hypothetical protein
MKTLLSFTLLITTILSNAQSILLEYNSTGAGRNVGVLWEKTIGKNSFGAGLGCNINQLAHTDDQNNLYHKRLYATKLEHFFNLHLIYDRSIFSNLKGAIKPFIFVDVQTKYSTTRNRSFLPYSFDSTATHLPYEERILYKEYIKNFGPFLWLEPTIGIGYRAMITDRLYIKQQIGAGFLFTFGNDDLLTYRQFSAYDWEFAALINVSIGWKLNPK